MLGLVLCLLASSGLGQTTKNVVAESCQAPYNPGATTTYKAPDGFLISGENYLVVTGCSAVGSIDGTSINATTDCITGRTAAKKLGTDVPSVTIKGGGYCGQARLTLDPKDNGIYGSSNPGIKLVGSGKAPSPVGSCCQAPNNMCGSKTYTAPTGFSISGDNYLVVTGCSASGYVVVNGKNLSATTDCVTGRTPGIKLGADIDTVTVYGGGYCGEARISINPNDLGVYGSANEGIKLVRKRLPNPVASCCTAPLNQCGNATVTAPPGTLISADNYFVVTGCSAAGTVVGTKMTAKTDCKTGRTPAQKLPADVASISITGGGHCGESRISLDPNDLGAYGSSNPGIYLTSIAVLLEESVHEEVHVKPALAEEGASNVARLKARVLA